MTSLSPAATQALLDGPASTAPPGQTMNMVNPDNLWIDLNVMVPLTVAISTISIVMRAFTKLYIMRRVDIVDGTILLSWAITITYCGLNLYLSKFSAGVHIWDVSLRNEIQYQYWIHVVNCVYCPAISLIKIAILGQYIQIFSSSGHRGYFFWTCWTLIIMNFVAYTILFFLELFNCSPMEKAWNPFITGGSCLNPREIYLSATAFNLISDFLIFILPLTVIWRLQLPTSRKFGISLVFAIGLGACAFTVVRLVNALQYLADPTDSTYWILVQGRWTLLELAFGILIACVPVSGRFTRYVGEIEAFSRLGSTLHTVFSNMSTRKSNSGLDARTKSRSVRLHDDHSLSDDRYLRKSTEDNDDPAKIVRTIDIELTVEPRRKGSSTGSAGSDTVHNNTGEW